MSIFNPLKRESAIRANNESEESSPFISRKEFEAEMFAINDALSSIRTSVEDFNDSSTQRINSLDASMQLNE